MAGDAGNDGGVAAMSPMNPSTLLAIADSLPVMIAYVDQTKRYAFANKPAADFFELRRRDMIGELVESVMGKGYEPRRIPLERALAGEAQHFTAKFDHPTRGALEVRAEYLPHVAPDGSVVGVIIVAQDISEQRATEVALSESEDRFRRIADSAPVMMWVTRLDRTRDFVNEAYLEFAGIEESAARTHDWRTWIHPDDIERVIGESLAGEASGEAFNLEARFRRADGAWRWLRSVSSPRIGQDNVLLGFIGAAQDITVAKEAEMELRRLVAERTAELTESEQRFRAVFDTVLEIIVLMKPDGTVLEVNRTEASWRDVDPSQAVGRKLWDSPTFARHPQHRAFARQAVQRAAAGEAIRVELPMGFEGAAPAVLDVSIKPVRTASGEVPYLLLEARDVTDLKVAQDQLRQSQKMEALGQLTGGIAHDFNNLLTVVVGGLDMITKKVTDERLARYANNALAAAERGVRLTGQLLTFSRSQRLEVRPCFVAPLVEGMRPLLRNVLGPGIQKQFDMDELMVPVMGDPTQIEVAVLNLAINARDAMPHGGILSFASRRVTIDDDPELDPGEYIELIVSDTGEGMTPEVSARVFEPFFTTKDVGKGTGLGLSMVYGMARQSGGTARVVSEEGKGTSISLFFRRAEIGADAAGEHVSAGALENSGSGASVVVIDDDGDVRGFIVTSLEEYGYRVDDAGDGPSGVALVEEVQPDVVVIDYVMPGMSGADVAAAILERNPDQALLFVSGYSETDDIRRAAPNAALLAKPFRPDALDAAVRAAIAGSRTRQARG